MIIFNLGFMCHNISRLNIKPSGVKQNNCSSLQVKGFQKSFALTVYYVMNNIRICTTIVMLWCPFKSSSGINFTKTIC